LTDRQVELVRLDGEHSPVGSPAAEHARDLVQRESGSPSHSDEREALDHAGVEETLQPSPADRRDQPLFLVET
jgi:hypothetical protein